jgi:protoheme IX farnesyltransferase
VSRVGDYLELSKARIVAMVLVTTAAGFALATNTVEGVLLLHTLLGTALIAGGTNALNQYVERDLDGRMARTRLRPLPDHRLGDRAALTFAIAVSILGAVYLAIAVNGLASLLAVLTLLSYVFIYTPLKTRTTLCTLIGAVPGAIPPMIGWAAATGRVDGGAWSLFLVMFLWQLPHFLAIGWIYREDYARAGFTILSVTDKTGSASGRQAVLYGLALIPASLTPVLFGIGGAVYVAGGAVAGALLVASALRFARNRSTLTARRLFLTSNVYLVLVMSLLVAVHFIR